MKNQKRYLRGNGAQEGAVLFVRIEVDGRKQSGGQRKLLRDQAIGQILHTIRINCYRTTLLSKNASHVINVKF
jgi:hypothetical protein